MSIDYKIYDTDTILGVMQELKPPTTYWLDLCFNRQVDSQEENIDLEKVFTSRKIAPFVSPFAQGRPIYSRRSELVRFKPAYIKLKDPVTAGRMIRKRPGELLSKAPNDPMARYNAVIGEISREHYDAVIRTWEWLAARAVIDGQVVIEDQDGNEFLVDFRRAASNTIILPSGARWGDSGVSIIQSIELFRALMRRPVDINGDPSGFTGGKASRITVGAAVWDVVRKNDELKEQLDLNTRGTSADFLTGIREMTGVEYVGNLAPDLPVYVYSETYEDYRTNDEQPYMSEKDVVLTGPALEGTRCFGAIMDKRAGLKPLPIFPKMWDEEDPSATQFMTQSSPLMVPLNPNASLKATVIN